MKNNTFMFGVLLMFIVVVVMGGCLYPQAKSQQAEQRVDKELQAVVDAALEGDADAQYELGFMYRYGDGITENHVKAVKWYQKAALQGELDVQKRLGEM